MCVQKFRHIFIVSSLDPWIATARNTQHRTSALQSSPCAYGTHTPRLVAVIGNHGDDTSKSGAGVPDAVPGASSASVGCVHKC